MFNEREIDHEKVWRIISHAPQECVGVIVLAETIISMVWKRIISVFSIKCGMDYSNSFYGNL